MASSRAAIYARTSTTLQNSCDTQLAICRQLVDDKGWQLRFRLRDDHHRGSANDRPGYLRLLDVVQERRIDAIVVWKLDRLFRSLKEASYGQELFAQAGVAVVSCTEPFDTTTPIGRLVFGFLANFAQFETELIKERALLGHERRIREGKFPGPHVPYGYAKGPDGKITIHADEARLVTRMHQNYKRLGGDATLAQWLNRRGETRRGARWNADRVRRALTDPTTLGELTRRGAVHHHPDLQIVTKERFCRTQEARSALRHLGIHRPDGRGESIARIFDAYMQILADEPPSDA